jgi:tRNA (cmo5U34)-methyltransferase
MTIDIPDAWSFDAPTVAAGFDNHVREQLPFYELATKAVCDLARLHLPPAGDVVDLGASTGNIGAALGTLLTERMAGFTGIECSPEMVKHYRAPGRLVEDRIENVTPWECDVVVSFLTLAFLAPTARRNVIAGWLDVIRPGGAFIAVERIQTPSSGALAARYLIQAAKLRAGAAAHDVVAKEVSIGGVLRPIPEVLFTEHGGWPFFTYGDFRGYIIEVPE